MRILYVPLDERPCNFDYPQAIANLQNSLELVVPPRNLLGDKKKPADRDRLWDWIEVTISDCQGAILSIEMLVYGGLLPSRLHQDSEELLRDRLDRIAKLKEKYPDLLILASNLIMRSPSYNSSEEEPDYYEEFGERIFRWGWLQDKQQREGITETETEELNRIDRELPSEYLQDYRQRRKQNLSVNKKAIALVEAGIIDFLSIPQDDCAIYGFTASDRQEVVQEISTKRLQKKINLYPGADEVGCTLLARICLQLRDIRRNIYVLYSSIYSEQIIPLYEDRPLGESLKAHILAVGGCLVSTPEAADFILAVNTPGQVMQEAWDNPRKDLTYTTHRNLPFFVDRIATFLQEGKPVAIADVAFANGGETELVELLDDFAAWDELLAYGCWNTCCNTLGTVLATAIIGIDASDLQAITTNKIYHLLEGWAYQTIVRMDLVKNYLPAIDASYYNFNNKEKEIQAEMKKRINAVWEKTMHNSFLQWQWEIEIFSPWQRMFEIGLDLTVSDRE
ncbi:DUF4127 family protein [Spirulina sp. 06S082]|uniref:DUF4127 family protein n=1 Tax=Spirulina sp. 06S082 TaxID=3110248 RepID=UPI002B206517|nr:DUF4127 family protein [Spirulina sp. 06S082]MEA5469942.1 DUF4127 family protein [Spirulina sp. 06S082]